MNKFISFSLLVISFFVSQAHAQLVVEELKAKSPLDLPGKKTAASKASNTLVQQKRAELEYRWSDCVGLAKTNLKKYSVIKQWVMVSYLTCATEQSAAGKYIPQLQTAVKAFDKDPEMKWEGPWRDSLKEAAVNARLLLLESLLKSDQKAAWAEVETLLSSPDLIDKSQMAVVYMHAGELAQAKAQLKAAQNFYEESLLRQETRVARDKLNSVMFALGQTKSEIDNAKSNEGSEQLSEAEERFETRVKSAAKDNDNISLLEDCVSYLLSYPNGKRAKWAHDKVTDIYLNLSEKGSDSQFVGTRDQALKTILKSDSSRLSDWARILHRRGEFVGSLQLAEKALQSQSASANAAVLLYIAGRSAEFTGAYVKAQKYFEIYLSQHSAAEDAVEVAFRLALTHLRQSQASSAIAVFEKLLLMKRNDRYELSSMYWMVRSLQATNNPRALTLTDEILQKYPFSYYGLRLALERSSGKLNWPTALEQKQVLKGSYFMLSFEKKVLTRMNLLAENNWLREAYVEATLLPTPRDAQAKVLLAQKLNHLEIYPGAIRLINEAGDINPELRSLDVINLSLPSPHQLLVETEAVKQNLNPILVKSLIRQESAFGPYAVSSSKAYGLMQLIGPTAQEVAGEIGLQNLKMPNEVFHPEINVRMGSYYISKMITQFGGNVPLGLAAYNAGPQRMKNFVKSRIEVQGQMEKASSDPWDEMWFDEVPWFETSFYVKAILRNSIMYKLAEKARAPSPDQRLVSFGPVLWADLVLK